MHKSELLKIAAARIILKKAGWGDISPGAGGAVTDVGAAPSQGGWWQSLLKPMGSGTMPNIPLNSPLGGMMALFGAGGISSVLADMLKGRAPRAIDQIQNINREVSPMVNEMFNRNILEA
jgi:hypothetical protein